MNAKSARAASERDRFVSESSNRTPSWAEVHWDAGLKKYLTEDDLRAIKAASSIAQRWASTGAFIGLLTGSIVGFPYPRKFSSVFLSSLSQIRRNRLAVPNGSSPVFYALARAHREGADAAGAKGLRDGTMNSSQFATFTVKKSLVGAAWALFFSFAGRTGGALASTWSAEQAIRENGGDVQRIKNAANQLVIEIEEARRQNTSRANEMAHEDADTRSDITVSSSHGYTKSDLPRRDDPETMHQPFPQQLFQSTNTSTPSAVRPDTAPGQQWDQGAISKSGGNTYAEKHTLPLSSSEDARHASRWEALRSAPEAASSTWERIRQDQFGRPTQLSAADGMRQRDSDAMRPSATDTVEDERQRQRREFEALLARQRAGEGEHPEMDSGRTRARFW